MSGPLRFGIMCASTRLAAWQAKALSQVVEMGLAVPVVVIVDERPGRASLRDRLARLVEWRVLLWNWYNKLWVERRSRASRPVDVAHLLSGVPVVSCRPTTKGRFAEYFSQTDLDAIAGHRPDFLIRFGFGIVKGGILDVAPLGVWSYHHGDERRYRGRPPAFWELVDGDPVVGVVLQRLTERLDAGFILHRGFFRTIPHSYVRTRDRVLLGSSALLARACKDVLTGRVLPEAPSTTEATVRSAPGNAAMLVFLLRSVWVWLQSQARGVARAPMWAIGVAAADGADIVAGRELQVRWLGEAGEQTYLADPFPIGGGPRALVEEYDLRTGRGVISEVSIDDPTPRPVIVPEVHASYPFVVEFGGDVFCIPETHQAREVRIYRAGDDGWEQAGVLLSGFAAVDPTVFEHHGRWWLLCTDHDEGPDSHLHAFSADGPLGPYRPHSLNPIKVDVRSARPGGTPFRVGGRLYRPAQDGSSTYGGALVINRIDVLTEARFEEQEVARLGPRPEGPYPDGLHTLSLGDGVVFVDGRRSTSNAAAMRREVAARFRRRRQGPA